MTTPEDHKFIEMIERKGGHAFPAAMIMPSGGTLNDTGMSLRDCFAAHALTGLIANDQCGPFDAGGDFSIVASKAYDAAEAMIKERRERDK